MAFSVDGAILILSPKFLLEMIAGDVSNNDCIDRKLQTRIIQIYRELL